MEETIGGVFKAWTVAEETRRLEGRLTYGATRHGSRGVDTGLERDERRIPGIEGKNLEMKIHFLCRKTRNAMKLN